MKRPLLLTYGMGIGPEITMKALRLRKSQRPLVLLGREEALENWQDERPPLVETLDNAEPVSRISFSDGDQAAEVAAIEFAAKACLSGRAAAMITGPINKKRLSERGFAFKGHTDFLGALCGAESVMAFTGGDLKVALVTTHIPLMSVGAALSQERIGYTVRTAAFHLKRDLGIQNPRIAVCGLNPHAGEEGLLGHEETETIHPCCDRLREEGYLVEGAVSAETAFLLAQKGLVDMVVAMYHDQGLAPLKAVDFGRSVNWTLGLPIIRTSVDHGTADSLVGKGVADPSSLLSAITLADKIVSRHSLQGFSQ